MRASAIFGIVAAIVVGAGLRLIWPADMEYKTDEVYTFERTQRVGVSEPFPWKGMSNSADVPHPGMSVWVFLGLAKLANAHDPVRLNVACMALNVLALLALTVFVAKVVPAEEREWWWWGLALASANPLEVVFHRKIWPPSVLPIVSVFLLTAWWYRDRKLGSFAFGFVGMLAAQIHPGAFFFVAGMTLWVLIFDRASVRWLSGLAGAAIASIPAWPWLHHLIFAADRSAIAKVNWWHISEMKFWLYWATEPFGLLLRYSLRDDFLDYLRGPLVDGQPTYLVAFLHALMVASLIAVVGRRTFMLLTRDMRASAPLRVAAKRSPTAFILGAVALGYGGLLTLSGLPIHRHYLIVTFPLMFVWAAWCAFCGWSPKIARVILFTMCVTQALASAAFLYFIHTRTEPIRGDYGAPYRMQSKN